MIIILFYILTFVFFLAPIGVVGILLVPPKKPIIRTLMLISFILKSICDVIAVLACVLTWMETPNPDGDVKVFLAIYIVMAIVSIIMLMLGVSQKKKKDLISQIKNDGNKYSNDNINTNESINESININTNSNEYNYFGDTDKDSNSESSEKNNPKEKISILERINLFGFSIVKSQHIFYSKVDIFFLECRIGLIVTCLVAFFITGVFGIIEMYIKSVFDINFFIMYVLLIVGNLLAIIFISFKTKLQNRETYQEEYIIIFLEIILYIGLLALIYFLPEYANKVKVAIKDTKIAGFFLLRMMLLYFAFFRGYKTTYLFLAFLNIYTVIKSMFFDTYLVSGTLWFVVVVCVIIIFLEFKVYFKNVF